MPSTIRGTTAPARSRGRPNVGCNDRDAAAAAARIVASASAETARKVSGTLARPAMSRHAIRIISRRRHTRSCQQRGCGVRLGARRAFVIEVRRRRIAGLVVPLDPFQCLRIAQQRGGDELAARDRARQFGAMPRRQARARALEAVDLGCALEPARGGLVQRFGDLHAVAGIRFSMNRLRGSGR